MTPYAAILTSMFLQLPAPEAIDPPPVAAPAPPRAPSGRPSPFEEGGEPPLIGVVERVEQGTLVMRKTVLTAEQETATVTEAVTVNENGRTVVKTVPRTVTRMRTARRSIDATYSLEDVRIFDLDGKPIPADRHAKLFTNPSIVLYQHFSNDSKVDPAYLKIARPGCVFVSLPEQAPIPVPAIPPVPVPSPPPPPTISEIPEPPPLQPSRVPRVAPTPAAPATPDDLPIPPPLGPTPPPR